MDLTESGCLPSHGLVLLCMVDHATPRNRANAVAERWRLWLRQSSLCMARRILLHQPQSLYPSLAWDREIGLCKQVSRGSECVKNTAEDLGSIRSFQDIRRLRSVMDKLPKQWKRHCSVTNRVVRTGHTRVSRVIREFSWTLGTHELSCVRFA